MYKIITGGKKDNKKNKEEITNINDILPEENTNINEVIENAQKDIETEENLDPKEALMHFIHKGAFYFERIKYHVGECALFPSEYQRDWSKFIAHRYKKYKILNIKLQNIYKLKYYGFKKNIKILSRRMEVLFNYIWRWNLCIEYRPIWRKSMSNYYLS